MRMPCRACSRQTAGWPRPTTAAELAGSPPRRGVAVVMVVACLATFSLIALAMLQGSLTARGQFRSEHHLRQAELLLDAAVARLASRCAAGGLAAFAAMDDLQTVPADEITGTDPATLSLSVDEERGQWQLTVVCTYPTEGPRAVRRSRVVVLRLPESESADHDSTPSPEPSSTPSSREETVP